jgi:protein-tyrosine phosphatase
MPDRNLDWDGCFNARDLGGLRTVDGSVTRPGELVRSDTLDHLTPAGWATLRAYGIRTIVDLRNDDELAFEGDARPAGITTVHVPLDDDADTGLWEHIWAEELDGTPLYYRLFLDRKPKRIAMALRAIAEAAPGGVVFHCGGGRDRTGLITLLLLALADVDPNEIVADYELSNRRLPPFWAAHGMEDQRAETAEILGRRHTSARELILALLQELDAADYLDSAGLANGELIALRARLAP